MVVQLRAFSVMSKHPTSLAFLRTLSFAFSMHQFSAAQTDMPWGCRTNGSSPRPIAGSVAKAGSAHKGSRPKGRRMIESLTIKKMTRSATLNLANLRSNSMAQVEAASRSRIRAPLQDSFGLQFRLKCWTHCMCLATGTTLETTSAVEAAESLIRARHSQWKVGQRAMTKWVMK